MRLIISIHQSLPHPIIITRIMSFVINISLLFSSYEPTTHHKELTRIYPPETEEPLPIACTTLWLFIISAQLKPIQFTLPHRGIQELKKNKTKRKSRKNKFTR